MSETQQEALAPEHQDEATQAVESISAAGVDSQPIPAADGAEAAAVLSVQLFWPADSTTSDCRIMDRKVTFFSDGRARFQARVRSSDTDDCWVYYGGIGIKDRNGTELWRSGKLIGPGMPQENRDYYWDQWFSYPALWYPYINRATLYGGHC
jgi:hypothetical protein